MKKLENKDISLVHSMIPLVIITFFPLFNPTLIPHLWVASNMLQEEWVAMPGDGQGPYGPWEVTNGVFCLCFLKGSCTMKLNSSSELAVSMSRLWRRNLFRLARNQRKLLLGLRFDNYFNNSLPGCSTVLAETLILPQPDHLNLWVKLFLNIRIINYIVLILYKFLPSPPFFVKPVTLKAFIFINL